MDIYADVANRLESAGWAYRCYCTAEELAEAREAAKQSGQTPGYPGTCRDLTPEQIASFEAAGRASVLRFRMPDREITWDDLVRGPITFGAEHVPDYVLVRANGDPLYTLVNPVDDALMRITHVLRGEDLLSSTPRQIALYEALADIEVGDGHTPKFGHLPYVMGEGNKKLSKRDPESSLRMYRETGYLPEGLLNYLALLGWSLGDDREFFSLEDMAAAFTLDRVNPNPARFDLKKCTAINADWIRHIPVEDFVQRLVPVLVKAGVLSDPPTSQQMHLLAAAAPLVHERMDVLSQAPQLLGFLFRDSVAWDEQDLATLQQDQARLILTTARAALADLPDWTTAAIETALRGALIDGLGLKPRLAFTPVRIALTGSRISPPLFESMELLGRDISMARLAAALDQAA
jgi:glutamyl-tRNA synthetase